MYGVVRFFTVCALWTALASSAHASRPPERAPPQDVSSAELPTLKAAEQLYQTASFGPSISMLDKLLRMPIDDKLRREALYLMALNFFSMRNEARAQAALQELLDFDPEFQIPTLSSPSARAFFAKVKASYKIIPQMTHTPPSQITAREGATLDVSLKRMKKSYEPRLFFRKSSDPYFSNIDLVPTGGDADDYRAVLPPGMLMAEKGYTLEYFIVVNDDQKPLVQLRQPQSPFSVPVDVPVSTASLPVHKRWYFWLLLVGGVAVASAAVATGVIVSAHQRGSAEVVFTF